jgi:hypothetical protein
MSLMFFDPRTACHMRLVMKILVHRPYHTYVNTTCLTALGEYLLCFPPNKWLNSGPWREENWHRWERDHYTLCERNHTPEFGAPCIMWSLLYQTANAQPWSKNSRTRVGLHIRPDSWALMIAGSDKVCTIRVSQICVDCEDSQHLNGITPTSKPLWIGGHPYHVSPAKLTIWLLLLPSMPHSPVAAITETKREQWRDSKTKGIMVRVWISRFVAQGPSCRADLLASGKLTQEVASNHLTKPFGVLLSL